MMLLLLLLMMMMMMMMMIPDNYDDYDEKYYTNIMSYDMVVVDSVGLVDLLLVVSE